MYTNYIITTKNGDKYQSKEVRNDKGELHNIIQNTLLEGILMVLDTDDGQAMIVVSDISSVVFRSRP